MGGLSSLTEDDRQGGMGGGKGVAEKVVEMKVYINNEESLSADEPGWFRIVFTQEVDLITEGMRRVFEALGA